MSPTKGEGAMKGQMLDPQIKIIKVYAAEVDISGSAIPTRFMASFIIFSKRGSPRRQSRSVSSGRNSDLKRCRHRNRGLEHLDCPFLVAQKGGEDAGEIVAHVQVVRIDEYCAVDPFARPFRLRRAGHSRRQGFPAQRRCLGPASPPAATPTTIFLPALSFALSPTPVASRKHRPGVEVVVHEFDGPS